MAALATITVSRSGVSVAGVAASVGGDTFTNTGKEVLRFRNASAGTLYAYFATPATMDGLAVSDRSLTLAAGAEIAIGPFPRYIYGTTVAITYSAVTSLTVAVLAVTPELV